jgi:uncharacterized Tic20 family protein
MLIIIILVIIIAPLIIHKFKWKKEEEEIGKAYTETSIKYLISIFFSIVASIAIALKADISPSSGHGAYIYIIGPGFFGALVMIVYMVSLSIFPEKKVIFGIIAILVNLGIGVYFIFSSF